MTPAPIQAPPQPQAQPATPTWWDVASSIPQDAPDEAYDGAREMFFQRYVLPGALKQGYDSELTRQNFMNATVRPGHTNWPRTQVVAKEAASAFMSPILGMTGARTDQSAIDASAQDAVVAARRQGVWTPPYQFAGQALGMAPYFAGGEALAGPALGALAGTEAASVAPLVEASRALSVGAIQGAYEAAKAPDHQRASAFGQGMVAGTALGAGWEALGGIAGAVRDVHGVSPDEAQAVEAVAKGKATPKQEAQATSAVVNSSGDVAQTVQQTVAQNIQAANKVGMPKNVVVDDVAEAPPIVKPASPISKITPDVPRVKIQMIGADGKPYTLGGGKGLTITDLNNTLELISNHLSNGAQIVGLGGTRKGVQQFMNMVADAGAPDEISVPLRAISRGVDPPKPSTVKTPLQQPKPFAPAKTVQDWLQTNPNADYNDIAQKFQMPDASANKVYDWWQDKQSALDEPARASLNAVINARDSLYHFTDLAGLEGIIRTGKIKQGGNDYPEQWENPTWTGQGVSLARSPESQITTYKNIGIVLDRSKLPRSVSRVEGLDDQPFGDRPSQYSPGANYEFEERLPPGIEVSTGAIKGLIGYSTRLDPGLGDRIASYANQLGVPYKVFANESELAKYRAVLSRLPESQRWAVSSTDIPKYDNFAQLPSGEILDKATGEVFPDIKAATQPLPVPDRNVYGMVRGSSDVPLSLKGRQQVQDLGQAIRDKGSLDELHTADLTRHKQTASALLERNPLTVPSTPNPELRSWALGGLEGQEHTPAISREINRLVENPSETPAGLGRGSTSLGESFGSFADRIISNVADKAKQVAENPGKKIGIVTSSRDIGVIKSWLGADGDASKFSEIMKRSHENPGDVYRIGPDEYGAWGIRQVNMDSESQLPGGVYLIRHGETPWNASARQLSVKQTPIGLRMVGSNPMLREGGGEGLTIGTTRLYNDVTDRGVIAHERYHGLTGGLDMHTDVMHLMDDPITDQLYRKGFDPMSQLSYGDDPYIWREEVYAHSLDAIRTGNAQKIQDFVEADTDHETYMQWFRDRTQDHLDIAAEKPDSIYKRAYERSLNDANNRATRYLDDINNYYSQSGRQLGLRDGDYTITDSDGARTTYPSRESALRALDEHHEPLSAPELVGLDSLPDNVPRFARSIRPPDGNRPTGGDPTEPALSGVRPARGRLDLLSAFIRPFHSWLAGVAERNNWPELYDAFRAVDDAQVEFNNFTRPYVAEIKDTLAKAPGERQKDYYTWFATPEARRLGVEQKLLFKPEEVEMLKGVQEKILDPLANEFNGVSLNDYVNKVLPQVARAGDVWKAFPDSKTDSFMVRKLKMGQVDPDEENLLHLVAHYLQFGAKNKFVDPALDAASDEVYSKVPVELEGRDKPIKIPRAGNLLPILSRHLDALRGKPDYTNEIVKGVMEGAANGINAGLEKVNSLLPKSMQIPKITELSEDPLGKFTLFQYAGTLGLKPATLIRDSLQYFITSYPIMGNYAFTGLKKVFPTLKMGSGEAKNLWDTARQYGALIEKSDLSSLYAASEDESAHIGEHSAENFAKWTLGMIQFSHNANRLAAFWGHDAQVYDALDRFRSTQDLGKFNRQSGMWFLDKPLMEKFNHELQTLGPEDETDFTHRVAAKLVEASQWNMRRGAQPMLYDYSLGRLFGQYGTWPLNYIDYARRFAAASDKGAAMQGLTRLVLAHGAILAAGQATGIDSGRWVFTQPAADWQGGPMFQMMLDMPKALDFDTAEGTEARHSIREEFFPGMVPGGVEAERLYEALATNDPDFWPQVLGFHVMQSSDYNRGLHSLFPKP
jgi:broad specificity phosphatase PhoE